MQALLSLLSNKIFLWILIIVGIIGVFGMRSWQQSKYNYELATYKRQLSGQLTAKERELQSMNSDLGVAKSELVTQDELIKRLKADKQETDKKFDLFKKKYNLEIKSRDITIASLKQQLHGGNSSTNVTGDAVCESVASKCVISYNWEDQLGRFKLQDPNIFEKGNETFESNQLFKVYGEIYEQRDGSLETRRLVLREVYKDKNGKFVDIPDAKANIVDSKFEYHNPPSINIVSSWTDLFSLRAIATGSVAVIPGMGLLRLGLGTEFFQYKGFGINTCSAIDFHDIKNWEHRLGIVYSPKVFGQDINFGLGLSAGTPYYKFGKQWSINLDLVFYINN